MHALGARSGEGAFIDISLSEAAGWFLTAGINAFSDHPYHIPASPDRRLYACADGRYVAVAAAEPRTWGALCEGLGLPALKDSLYKAEAAEAVTKMLAEVFLARPANEWVEILAPKGAAVTIVNRGAEALTDPHILARGSVVDCAGTPVPASPMRITTSAGPAWGTNTAAPHLVGQDTADVLAAAGFSADEIKDLAASGVT